MAKKVYQAIGKDGIVYQRTSDRDYGFAVVQRGIEAKTPSFCGRADLADKQAARFYADAEAAAKTWDKVDPARAAELRARQYDVLLAKRIK